MTPGVDPHTHRYTSTGSLDSKFGFPLPLKEEAVAKALKIRGLNVVGLHFHIGSLIFEPEPYVSSSQVRPEICRRDAEKVRFGTARIGYRRRICGAIHPR